MTASTLLSFSGQSAASILVTRLLFCALLAHFAWTSAAVFTKKGVSFGSDSSSDAAKCADLSTFNISWYYNWGSTPSCQAGAPGVEFIPMIWSAGSLPIGSLPSGSDWLLGFNEPNYYNQAHMDPSTAATLWPQLQATGRRLVGPAVADCGDGLGGECTYGSLTWYREFLGNCSVQYPGVGCRLDAVALHLYYCSAQDQINKLTALYELTQRPIWLTEFACNAPSSAQQPTQFAQSLIPRLEASPIVERYSWFISYCAGCGAGDLLYDSLLQDETGQGHLTPVGQYYSSVQSTSVVTVTPTYSVNIDCGNLSPSEDGTGVSWLADIAFSLSPSTSTASTSAAVTASPSSTSYLYQTFRSGAVTYTIPVSAIGSYAVTLGFAEYQAVGVGQRTFSVSVQGVVINSAYDIVRAAGGVDIATTLQATASVTAATGLAVVIQLTAGQGVPIIAAVRVAASGSSQSAPQVTPLYLSMSGNTLVDASGNQWTSAVPYTSGGTVSPSVSNTIVGAPASLQNIYNSNQWGAFTVTVPVSASGCWQATLLFAECYWTTAGQRIFTVSLQGVQVESHLDIIARSGAEFRALNTSYNVTVSPDNPYFVLTTTNIADNGLVSGIILKPCPASASAPVPTAAPTPTSTAAPSPTSGAAHTPTSAAGQSPSASTGTAFPSFALYINSGSTSGFTDASGHVWQADGYYSASTNVWTGTQQFTNTTSDLFPLYNSNRYNNVLYSIPVPSAGVYRLTLHYAEIYWTAVGKRVFSVAVQGVTQISQLDLMAVTGAEYSAYVTTHLATVNATVQSIALKLSNIKDNALVCGVEVVRQS